MRTLVVEKPVRDVEGLWGAIRAADPDLGILSVGADARRTYLYIEDTEPRDPSAHVWEWTDLPELRLLAQEPPGADGVAETAADGEACHTVLVEKVAVEGGVLPGDEKLVLVNPENVSVTPRSLALVDGRATVLFGPSKETGEFTVEVRDAAGRLRPARVRLRFVRRRPLPPAPAQPAEEGPVVGTGLSKESAWNKIRRILKL